MHIVAGKKEKDKHRQRGQKEWQTEAYITKDKERRSGQRDQQRPAVNYKNRTGRPRPEHGKRTERGRKLKELEGDAVV